MDLLDRAVLIAVSRRDDFSREMTTAEPLEPVWEHSAVPEERALEIWVGYLATSSRIDAIRAAHALAAYVFPLALERGGAQAQEFLYEGEAAEWADGAPTGEQLRRVAQWLDDPSDVNADHVASGVDPSRQLNVWDDDLFPSAESMWAWMLEVGQLLSMAVVEADDWGDGRPEEAYSWPWHVAAARAAVCALKTMRLPDGAIDEDLRTLLDAAASALTS